MNASAWSGSVTDARHPIRSDVDGDFPLDDLLGLPAAEPARRSGRAAESARAGRWSAATPAMPVRRDEQLLHVVETSMIVRPPVRAHLDGLTPAIAVAWLALAARWIDLSRSGGDLRFLNAACKLTGAALLLHHEQPTAPTLTGQLAAVGRLIGVATERLAESLAQRGVPDEPDSTVRSASPQRRLTGPSRASIVVLAGAGSRTAGRVVAEAGALGLPIRAVCWYGPGPGPCLAEPAVDSNYATAWYPPGPRDDTGPAPVPDAIPTTTATTWDDVEAALRAAGADLVLLVGMPIVPARVLDAARLGVLNAHNGALPGHRGMDAVGWALLYGRPVVCTLHLARPAVDAGEVIAVETVPVAPTLTLGARVKSAQIQLLLGGAAHVAATGVMPNLTPQPAGGTQFYRLHPHLKRVLDASPYSGRVIRQ